MTWLKSQLKVRWNSMYWLFGIVYVASLACASGIEIYYGQIELGFVRGLMTFWVAMFLLVTWENDRRRNTMSELFKLLKEGSDLTSEVIKLYAKSEEEKGLWLIWSNEHDAWWCPLEKGYTKERRNAGIYSFSEACKIVESANIHLKNEPNEAMVKYIEPSK